MTDCVIDTDLPLPGKRSGKVRDIYDLRLADGTAGVLVVATDRISAFDVVMANGLPGKGILLTQLARFWFDRVGATVPHHLLSTRAADVPGLAERYWPSVDQRAMVCRKTAVLPIECIARGYLAGSGLKEYRSTGTVCGIPLPAGLRAGDRLPEPIFTPSTKAVVGHDENISYAQGVAVVGERIMAWLRDTTLRLYNDAAAYAASRGIVMADTKFEFGMPLGQDGAPVTDATPLLIDEIFTPDSSRFWPAADWQPGHEQPSFDKQFLRDYLETLVADGRWHKQPPGPLLPAEIVNATLARYREAFERLTGESAPV